MPIAYSRQMNGHAFLHSLVKHCFCEAHSSLFGSITNAKFKVIRAIDCKSNDRPRNTAIGILMVLHSAATNQVRVSGYLKDLTFAHKYVIW